MGGKSVADRHQIFRSIAVKGLNCLFYFQIIADGEAKWFFHRGQLCDRFLTGKISNCYHFFGEFKCLFPIFHKGTISGRDIKHDAVASRGKFFAHNGRRDQWDALDGSCRIAQGVDFFVCRCKVRRLAIDTDAGFLYGIEKGGGRKIGVKTGNGFQLIDGSAGKSQSAATHFGNRNAAGGRNRPNDKSCLVANTAGTVLVYFNAINRGEVVDRTRIAHCQRHRRQFAVI
ncbi:unknown [Roseburia sp. CAG:309]|nr:unknown [Roseburia sp. CAG:309]